MMFTEPLDPQTEETIMTLVGASSGGVQPAIDALRIRIRELVQEARPPFTREDTKRLQMLLSAFAPDDHIRDWLPELAARIERSLSPL